MNIKGACIAIHRKKVRYHGMVGQKIFHCNLPPPTTPNKLLQVHGAYHSPRTTHSSLARDKLCIWYPPGMSRTTNGHLFLGSYTCHGVRSLISTGGALIHKNNINTTLLFRKLPVFNANVYSLNSILSKFKKIQYFKHLDI